MSQGLSFAHLWQQDDMADVELVLPAAASAESQESSDVTVTGEVLQRFPAHSVILSNSPYMKADLLRWKRKRAHGSHCSDTEASTAAGRQQLVLTLQDAAQQPAALAVLAFMYAVKPLPALLSDLSQEQQLHAALLADMWQVPAVSTAAVKLLVKAAGQPDAQMSLAFQDAFLQLGALPACVLPLLPVVAAACMRQDSATEQKAGVKRLLLSVLGDLEEVWADAALQEVLLGLPLPAMELLLSCTELTVASEDTVLYTAQTYMYKLSGRTQQRAAQLQLQPLIRCPHLSHFWLSALAWNPAAPRLLLSDLQPQVQQLLTLQLGDPTNAVIPRHGVSSAVRGCPASWDLPKRAHRAARSVTTAWYLPVRQLKEAAQTCARQRQDTWLYSGSVSAPIGGVVFKLSVGMQWEAAAHSISLNLFLLPQNVPMRSFCSYAFNVQCVPGKSYRCQTPMVNGNSMTRFVDFWGVGVMAGGWDAAAWAAKGLPGDGELKITATVTSVAHMK